MNRNEKTYLAICYDFDKTLTPKDMQSQGFIQEIGFDENQFWSDSNGLAKTNNMDQNLAYMYQMKTQSRGTMPFTKKVLTTFGEQIELYEGVEDWFDRINEYGKEHNIEIEHYIISCGLKEMIEGTKIAKKGCFKRIYACSFYYDDKNVAIWPAQVVNYTNKTQFLFRIEKGILDINDEAVNDKVKDCDLRIPFRNMVYIGDSLTDVPCMKLVKTNGGKSICVYDSNMENAYKMINDDRVDYFAHADYRENSELDLLIKNIINKVSAENTLTKTSNECKNTAKEETKVRSINDLLVSLYNSASFSRTHELIGELKKFNNFTSEEKLFLVDIAANNSQVYYILGDMDIKEFFNSIIPIGEEPSNIEKKVLEAMERNYKDNKKILEYRKKY